MCSSVYSFVPSALAIGMLKVTTSEVVAEGNVPPLSEGVVLTTIGVVLATVIGTLGEMTGGKASCCTVTLTLNMPDWTYV